MTAINATFKRTNPNALPPLLAGKLLALVLALTVAFGLLIVTVSKAHAEGFNPVPRRDVMVKDANVKLGDVFDGVQQNADFVLAPAPQPGQELVWNQATLLRIATAFDMPWRPQSGDEIHIRRDASLIDKDTLKSVLRDHMAQSGDPAMYQITLTSDVPDMVVPNNGTPRVEVADFNMQPVGGTFAAVIKVSDSNGNSAQTVNVRGVADRVVSIPVLKSDKHNGEVISAADIETITRKATTVGPNVVHSPEEMIGSTPRHAISAGALIHPDDLEMPQMVSRGELVTMIFNQNGMYLTAKGKAMEDGAMGQSIKVTNVSSDHTIEGKVTGNKEITVN